MSMKLLSQNLSANRAFLHVMLDIGRKIEREHFENKKRRPYEIDTIKTTVELNCIECLRLGKRAFSRCFEMSLKLW